MKRAFAILGTALLVALGLFLPRFAAAYQEHSLAGEVRQIENAPVSLTLAEELVELTELDLLQSLELFASHVTMVELEEGQHTSAEGATRIAEELEEHLNLDLYFSGDIASPAEAVPFLLTDADGRSGIFWRCGWEDRPNEEVWIDDQNGNLVGFRLRTASLPAEIVAQVIFVRFFPTNVDADVFWADDGELCVALYRDGDAVFLPAYHDMEYLYFNIHFDTSADAVSIAD